MSSDDRLTWGLVMEILDALEKHGYHRADNQHTGRAIGFISDLARIYEGTLEAPAGACVVPVPASPQSAADPENPALDKGAGTGAAQRETILAALDEAADRNRDLAANRAEPSVPMGQPDNWDPAARFGPLYDSEGQLIEGPIEPPGGIPAARPGSPAPEPGAFRAASHDKAGAAAARTREAADREAGA